MKTTLLSLFIVFSFSIAQFSFAQSSINWTSSVDEVGDNEFLITFDAKLTEGWYIYSQNPGNEDVKPTAFLFEKNDDFELIGEVREYGKIIEARDPIFEAKVRKYADNASFQIAVRTKKDLVNISGLADYLTCSDRQCLKGSYGFELNLLVTKVLSPPTDTFSAADQFKMPEQQKYANDDYTSPTSNFNISNSPLAKDPHDHSPGYNTQELGMHGTDHRLSDMHNSEKEVDLSKKSDKLIASTLSNYLVDTEEPFLELEEGPAENITEEKVEKEPKSTEEVTEQKASEPKSETAAQKPDGAQLAITDSDDAGALTDADLPSSANPMVDPIKWTTEMVDMGKGTYELITKGLIDKNWHLYSQTNNMDGNPLPAQLHFKKTKGVEILDEVKEVAEIANVISSGDPVFENKPLKRIAHEVTYKTKVRFTENVPVTGILKYMAADNQRYLLPNEVTLKFNEAQTAVPAKKIPASMLWAIGLGAMLLGLGYFIRKSERTEAIADTTQRQTKETKV